MKSASASSLRALYLVYSSALLLALGIILWGAWVRMTGSGDGCGEHWPLCQGVLLPDTLPFKTVVELIHRVTSGAFGILILVGVITAWRAFGSKHLLTKYAVAALIATVLEALIGAKLVLLGLVAADTSAARVIVASFHLVNTLFLTGTLIVCCHLSRARANNVLRVRELFRGQNLLGVLYFALLGMTGVLASLANTLYKAPSLAAGFAADFSSDSPWMVQLRLIHPVFGLLAPLFFLWLLRDLPPAKELKLLRIFIFLQALLGILTLSTSDLTFLRLSHLFIFQLSWLLFIYGKFCASDSEGKLTASPIGR